MLYTARIIAFNFYFTVINGFENVFYFEENCSYRDEISNKCVSCHHGSLRTPITVTCTPDFVKNICPESVKIEKFYIFSGAAQDPCLTLKLKFSEVEKVQSADIRAIWNRPVRDKKTSKVTNSSDPIHRSTLTFTDYNYSQTRKTSDEEPKLSSVVRNVTLCGLFNYGSYDIETVVHPLCNSKKGVCGYTHIDMGSAVLNNFTPNSRLETWTSDNCPVPSIKVAKITTADPLEKLGAFPTDDQTESSREISLILILLFCLFIVGVCCGVFFIAKRTRRLDYGGSTSTSIGQGGQGRIMTSSRLSVRQVKLTEYIRHLLCPKGIDLDREIIALETD